MYRLPEMVDQAILGAIDISGSNSAVRTIIGFERDEDADAFREEFVRAS